jgi:hypothetical protein
MNSNRLPKLLCTLLGLACFGLAPSLPAQTTTGGIRGFVTSGDAPVAGAEIQARNTATGAERRATANARGYYVLSGMIPGTYQVNVRHIGHKPVGRPVQVQVGQQLTLDFALEASAVQLEEISVSAAAPTESRSTEVATNVTPEQVEKLPTSDRNFLSLAVLAPGVRLQGDRVGDVRKTITAGAQGAEQINVFIDGASYKNDILKGGVAGQDASRGNPFPRNAVQEFRVITQNYKAEYQKASSAIITATTRSGSNEWAGNAFFSYQNRGLVALDTFQIADKEANPNTFRKPDYRRQQLGVGIGGPIIRDRLHLFASYEGNYQDRTNRVNIVPPTGFPALDTVNFAQYNGEFEEPFNSTLFFGKLSYAATQNSWLDLSLNLRDENDIRGFGGNTSNQSATRFNNEVSTGVLKHTWSRSAWLNEAAASYQHYRFNPTPFTTNQVARLYGFGCCAQIGSNRSIQDFTQDKLSFRNDITYGGLELGGSHVVKMGANIDFSDYDVIKKNDAIPLFVYEPWFHEFEIPQRVEFRAGDPNFSTKNTQIGAYIQDDWSPSRRLSIYLGMRWDYESGMLNYDFQTPSNIRDSLIKYESNLFIPLDRDRYLTDGTQRSRFLDAFQPRVGFSYGLDNDNRTTIFGSWGIFYDRTLFDQATEERFEIQNPRYRIEFYPTGGPVEAGKVEWDPIYLTGSAAAIQQLVQSSSAARPEAKLLPNDLRPPKSNQFSVGIRRQVGDVMLEGSYNGVRSNNTFTFYWADRDFVCPERSFGVAGCFVERPVPGFSVVLFADNGGKTWYDAFTLKADRHFRSASGLAWGGGISYTLAKRQTEGFNDDFSFPSRADYPKQVRNDERHRVVGNWILLFPWAGGLEFSGLATIGSGLRYDVGDRFGGTSNPFEPGAFDAPTYKNVDLRLRKEIPFYRGNRFGVAIDAFNVFNTMNLGDFIVNNRADANFGKARQVISDPRRIQFGVDYTF